jgi:hypothetical protein
MRPVGWKATDSQTIDDAEKKQEYAEMKCRNTPQSQREAEQAVLMTVSAALE